MAINRNIRVFVDNNLSPGMKIILSERLSHYLCSVMRCKAGERIKCFNNHSGEFFCAIDISDKKATTIEVEDKFRDTEIVSDLWLLFSPLKKDRTDFVIEKSVELGVSKIIPVITERTNSEKIKLERFIAQSIEASEQCGRLSIPEVKDSISLNNLLLSWDSERTLFFMDERRKGEDIIPLFKQYKDKPAAILIGPEGGFSDEEAKQINGFGFVKNVSLGPRILRAETAATVSLALWQAAAGDWQEGE